MRCRVWNDTEVCNRSLEEGLQAGENRLPEHAGGPKFVGPHPFKPHTRADLMASLDHLHLIGKGKQALGVEKDLPGGASCRRDAAHRSSAADASADRDRARL